VPNATYLTQKHRSGEENEEKFWTPLLAKFFGCTLCQLPVAAAIPSASPPGPWYTLRHPQSFVTIDGDIRTDAGPNEFLDLIGKEFATDLSNDPGRHARRPDNPGTT
jgi:hypothetical protein